MPWKPQSTARCFDCGHLKGEHDGDDCPNNIADVYGRENPMVRWLREHAPQALREKAGARFQPEEEESCGT